MYKNILTFFRCCFLSTVRFVVYITYTTTQCHDDQNFIPEPEGIVNVKPNKKKQKQTKDNKTCKTVKLHLFILTKKNQKKNINAMCITFIHSILVDVFSFLIIDREEKILTETRNMIKIWACFVLFFHFILFIYFVTTQQNKTKKNKTQ